MNRVFTLIDAISSGDKASMETAFANAMREKVATALDVRKVQLTAKVYGKINEAKTPNTHTVRYMRPKIAAQPGGPKVYKDQFIKADREEDAQALAKQILKSLPGKGWSIQKLERIKVDTGH